MNQANARIIANDTRLRGLALVLDPLRATETLQALKAIDAGQSLKLDYIRYKAGRRALALLHLVDPAGVQRSLVINAYDQAGWQKFLSSGHADELLKRDGLVLAETQCSVGWFPFDRHLRQISKLFDQSRTESIFKRLLDIPESPQSWQLQTLTYKPGRRFVAKAVRGPQVFAVKCYTKEDYRLAHYRATAMGHADFQPIVTPTIACSDRYCMLASQWVEGDTLAAHLSGRHDRTDMLGSAGRLLKLWHDVAHNCLPQITSVHPGCSNQSLNTLLDDIAWLLPELRQPLIELIRQVEDGLAVMRTANDVIHGDFYAKQILVGPDGFRLIDFDEISRGHRYQDLGNFVGQLYWEMVRSPSSANRSDFDIESSIEALLLGNAESMESIHWPTLRASILIGILRCLPHAFRRGLPDWPDRMREMFQYASSWIDLRPMVKARNLSSEPVMSTVIAPECAPYLDMAAIDNRWKSQRVHFEQRWWDTGIESARLLRHKQGRRCLVEYTVTTADRLTTVQVLGKARIGKSIDKRLLKLHQDLQPLRQVGVVVPRAIGHIPDMNIWFQEKLDGQDALLTCSPIIHRVVGAALAELHGSEVVIDRSHNASDELQTLHAQYSQWLSSCSCIKTLSNKVLILADCAISGLQDVRQTLIHRDFYFDQVIELRDGIGLVDFDLAAMGPPELDVGNYLAHLDEYAMRCTDAYDYCNQCTDEFLAGYAQRRSNPCACNVAIWRFLSLARLAAISQRVIGRAHTTEAILRKCLEFELPKENEVTRQGIMLT